MAWYWIPGLPQLLIILGSFFICKTGQNSTCLGGGVVVLRACELSHAKYLIWAWLRVSTQCILSMIFCSCHSFLDSMFAPPVFFHPLRKLGEFQNFPWSNKEQGKSTWESIVLTLKPDRAVLSFTSTPCKLYYLNLILCFPTVSSYCHV